MDFKIESGIPMPPQQERGRKEGSKDSKKFPNRGRKKSPIPLKAAEAVRNGEYQDIKEAAQKFFDEHVGFPTSDAERKGLYAERFRDFTNLICKELIRNPGKFNTFRILGNLHNEKMKNYAYKRSYNKRQLNKLLAHLKECELI